MLEGEKWLSQIVLWFHMCTVVPAIPHTHTEIHRRSHIQFVLYKLFHHKDWWSDVFHFLKLPESCKPTWDKLTLVNSDMTMRTYGKTLFSKLIIYFPTMTFEAKMWLFVRDWQFPQSLKKYGLHNIYDWQENKRKSETIFHFGEMCNDYCVCKPLCLPLASTSL